MPIGTGIIYNVGDLILSQVSGSGTAFLETKIAAATSSLIYFDSTAKINSASLNSITVGTASYVSGSTSIITNLTASNISASGTGSFGMVGIGTTSPNDLLHLRASSATAYDATSDNGQFGSGAGITIENRDETSQSFAQVNLQVSGNAGRALGRIVAIRTASATSDLAFVTENANTKAEKMRILSDGNVGIGTTAPGARLEISSSTAASLLNVKGAGGNGILFVSGSGNVGIGTSSPSSAVSFNKVVEAYDATSLSYQVNSGGTYKAEFGISSNGGWLGTSTTHDMRFASNGTERMRITSSGSLLIGDTTQTYGPTPFGYMFGVKSQVNQSFISIAKSGQTLDSGGIVLGLDTTTAYLWARENIPISFGTNNNEKVRIAADGNVGIGTSSPVQKLEVQSGSVLIRGDGTALFGTYYASAGENTFFTLHSGSGNTFHIGNDVSGTNYNTMVFTAATNSAGGNVGIGTTIPGQKLEVNGRGLFTGTTDASAGSLQVTAADAALRLKWTYSPVADKNTWDIRSVGTGATPYLQFRTVNDANTVFTDRVAFTNDGNVGIGTTDPDTVLTLEKDITYNAEFGSHGHFSVRGKTNTSKRLDIGFNTATDVGFIQAMINGTSYNNLLLNANGGNVGIGTTNPTAKLTVNGNLGFSGDSNNYIYMPDTFQGTGSIYMQAGFGSALAGGAIKLHGHNATTYTGGDVEVGMSGKGNFLINGYIGGTRLLTVSASGNVGIGTTSPAYKLDVNGTIALSGFPFADKSGNYNRIYEPAGNVAIYLGNASDQGNYYDNTTHYFRNRGGASNYVIINNSGNVGIGTSSPTAKLHIYNGSSHFEATSNGNAAIVAGLYALQIAPLSNRDSTAGSYYGGIAFNHLLNHNGVSTYNGAPQAWIGTRLQDTAGSERDYLVFATKPGTGTSGTGNDIPIERVCIDRDGLVGIGTTSPGALLHVYGATPTIRVQGSSAASAKVDLVGTYTTWSLENQYVNGANNDMFRIYNSALSADAITINRATNNVGIGATNPAYLLDVSGSSRHGYRAADTHQFTGSVSVSGSLNATASWASNAVTSLVCTGNAATATTASYANALNAANSYTVVDVNTTGNIRLRNGDPTITLSDTNDSSSFIHVDGNYFSILCGPPNASFGEWVLPANGRWPMEISLTNNTSTFGGSLDAISFTGSGSGLFGTAAGLSIGGTAATASYANALNAANTYTIAGLTSAYVDVNGSGTIPTTGIYRPSTKTLGLSADGTLIFKISNVSAPATSSIETGNFVVQSGNVGIGTTSPIQKLSIIGATEAGVNTSTTGGPAYYIRYDGANGNYLNSIGAEFSSGNMILGYGATGKASSAGYVSTFANFAGHRSILMVGAGTLEFKNSRASLSTTVGSDVPMTSSLYIDNTGNVGIGTSSPVYKLEVNGNFAAGGTSTIGTTYPQLTLNGTTSQHAYLMVNRTNYESGIQFQTSGTTKWWMYMPSGNDTTLRFYTNQNSSGDILNLTNTGLVGIGTTSPNKKLQIIGSLGKGLNLYEIPIDNLGAVGTQAKRFEIARVFIDYNDWNNTGVIEIEVRESYYSDGRYKRYVVSYGYASSNTGSLWLVEDTGRGSNDFKAEIGAAVQVTGDIYYVPIYIDVDYYLYVDVLVITNRPRTTNDSFTAGGVIYINESPTGSNISSFGPDEVTYISLASNKTYLGYGGNVGIGTSNPGYKLDVNGPIGISGFRFVDQSTHYFRIFEPAGNIALYLGNAADPTNYYDNTSHAFRNRGGSSNYVTINSSGNVGIGTTSPASRLHVVGSEAYIRVTDSDDSGVFFIGNTSGFGYIRAFSRDFRFLNAAGTSLIDIASGGNIGIGITGPSHKLDVNGSINTNTFMYVSYPYGNAYPLQISANNFLKADDYYYGMLIRSGDVNYISGKFQINGGSNKRVEISGYEETIGYLPVVIPGGNVGIGTTSPTAPLHVVGVISGSSFTGAGTGLTGTAASLTAGAVTNGVYTTGAQSVGGVKSFTSTMNVTGVRETMTTVAAATNVAINLNLGTIFKLTFSSTVSTFTITNTDNTNVAAGNSFTLISAPDNSNAKTIAFSFITNGAAATAVKWATFAGGTTPTATITSGKFDVFSFVYDGVNWYGFTGGLTY